MADGYGTDPTGGELADIARQGAREWASDMAMWESDAEDLRLRQRTLTNLLWESMQRGDTVTLGVADLSFSGTLLAARGDLAMLQASDRTVALQVPRIKVVAIDPGEGEGLVGDRTYGSFQAYLGMLEVEGHAVRLLGEGVDVRGRIEVVAQDHVFVRSQANQTEWAISLEALVAVVTRNS